jgi:predicted RNase H-like nuclease
MEMPREANWMDMKIIGVDCATAESKIGLALGSLSDNSVEIQDATLCTLERSAAMVIAGWLKDGEGPALIALDAPLGWPKPLAESLIHHRAGEPIRTPAHAMFRRETDQFIHREIGKTPLDVGADRIARTAHAALQLLATLRDELSLDIPLAWDPADVSTVAAIEVYPAATLDVYGIRSTGYKKPEQIAERQEILDALRSRHKLTKWNSVPDLCKTSDLLDAAICVVAGQDFIKQRAMNPENRELAESEGWIWVTAKKSVP